MLTFELWRVDYADPAALAYSVFNLLEAFAWFGVAGWVLHRHAREPRTGWSWAYAALFILFGFTDVVESQRVQPWLIGVKGAVLMLILLLRYKLVRRYYIGAKM